MSCWYSDVELGLLVEDWVFLLAGDDEGDPTDDVLPVPDPPLLMLGAVGALGVIGVIGLAGLGVGEAFARDGGELRLAF